MNSQTKTIFEEGKKRKKKKTMNLKVQESKIEQIDWVPVIVRNAQS